MGAAISDGPNRLIAALSALAHQSRHDGAHRQAHLKLPLVVDSDSQLLACEGLCSAPTALDVHWTINVIPRDGTPQVLLQRLAQRPTCAIRAWLGCRGIDGCRALMPSACS